MTKVCVYVLTLLLVAVSLHAIAEEPTGKQEGPAAKEETITTLSPATIPGAGGAEGAVTGEITKTPGSPPTLQPIPSAPKITPQVLPGPMVPGKMGGRMGGRMSEMKHMCGMMMKTMMSKSVVETGDGGIVLLSGNKLTKYDKDLNLVKSVAIDVDMGDMQKMMMQMAEKCPMCAAGMQGGMSDEDLPEGGGDTHSLRWFCPKTRLMK